MTSYIPRKVNQESSHDERGNYKWETYSTSCYENKHSKCQMLTCKCGCHLRNQDSHQGLEFQQTITQESQS